MEVIVIKDLTLKNGFAYIDVYGFEHVTSKLNTAMTYVKPGTEIYEYYGSYGGGYALDEEGNRGELKLPGARTWGNALTIDTKPANGSIGNIVPV